MTTGSMIMPATLVAVSREGHRDANSRLMDWLRAKIAAVRQDLGDLEVIERKAMERSWERTAERRLRRQTEASLTWYEKLLGALEQGYTLMPDLQMRLFALRRPQESTPPTAPNTESERGWGSAKRRDSGYQHLASVVLPRGEGAFVNPDPERAVSRRYIEQEPGKEPKTMVEFQSVEHRAVALPVALLRPELVEATDRALQERIFDEIGICEPTRSGRRGDPLVLGRIYRDSRKARAVCFVIGWYVEVRDLL